MKPTEVLPLQDVQGQGVLPRHSLTEGCFRTLAAALRLDISFTLNWQNPLAPNPWIWCTFLLQPRLWAYLLTAYGQLDIG